MNTYLKTLILLPIVFIFLSFAFSANASLVPTGCADGMCTPCDIWPLADNITWFALYGLALPIMVVVLLVGGILMLTSAGNQSSLEKGKALIWNGIVGILIAFVAYLVINTIVFSLASGTFTVGWMNVDEACSNTRPPTDFSPSGGNQAPTQSQLGNGFRCSGNGGCASGFCNAAGFCANPSTAPVGGGGVVACDEFGNCVPINAPSTPSGP